MTTAVRRLHAEKAVKTLPPLFDLEEGGGPLLLLLFAVNVHHRNVNVVEQLGVVFNAIGESQTIKLSMGKAKPSSYQVHKCIHKCITSAPQVHHK